MSLKTSIANTIDFFDESLGMNSGVSGHSQIWFWKELSNGLALAAAFVFILSLCAVLVKTPFFATLNSGKGDCMKVSSAKRHTVSHKVIFWSSVLLTAIIACLDYIPLANLSIEIFPVGNSAKVFTFVFPARMVNAILLWALVNGTIGLIIFFGTTIAEWAYEKAYAKAKAAPCHRCSISSDIPPIHFSTARRRRRERLRRALSIPAVPRLTLKTLR